jgi:hypothetical protein
MSTGGKEWVRGLRFVKKLRGGVHAASVELWESRLQEQGQEPLLVVKKSYKLTGGENSRFKTERAVLARLTEMNCDFAPKLLHSEITKGGGSGILYMTYCGKAAKRTTENREAVRQMRARLQKDFGVRANSPSYRTKFFGWLRGMAAGSKLHNVTQSSGRLFLIDFGSRHFKVLPRPTPPLPVNGG